MRTDDRFDMEKAALLNQVAENELMQFLGVTIETAEPDLVVLKMPVTPRVHQYVGIMNGGVSLYLAETAASVGVVAGSDLANVTPVGIEINANHIRAVSRGELTVTAVPLHQGATLAVWKIDITDERERLICTSRITLLIQKRAAFRT